MDFEEWEPYYARILEDFGSSREEDERSAKVLDAKLGGDRIPLDALARVLLNQPVTVAGDAPGPGGGARGLPTVGGGGGGTGGGGGRGRPRPGGQGGRRRGGGARVGGAHGRDDAVPAVRAGV